MNFTREPIIETVIMPREGYKLLVRNSKTSGMEDYYVDSIEVVSFGHSLFFRSQERPKSFLVPVTDYEILETKEVRVALKNAAPEKAIKIGGGREVPVRSPRDTVEADPFEPNEREHVEPPQRNVLDRDRKRDKRRRGRRGGGRTEAAYEQRDTHLGDHEAAGQDLPPVISAVPRDLQPTEFKSEEPKAPSFISKLFPPPPTLIKDSLSRYRTAEADIEGAYQKEDKIDDVMLESSTEEERSSNIEEPPFDE